MTAAWARFPEVTHVVGPAEIAAYVDISGDHNPLHVDVEYAASTPFGSLIAHGPIGLQALFEAVTAWLGTDHLPSAVGIDVAYRRPVRVGDSVTAGALSFIEHANRLVVVAACRNQHGEEILQALVTVPRELAPRDG